MTGSSNMLRRVAGRVRIPALITVGVLAVLGVGGLMLHRASARTNRVALAAASKGVTVVAARSALYHTWHRYVGTVSPWLEARLGPQYTSAYVDTVLVRPGAAVRRGQVLATLDCRNVSAVSKAIAMQARALATKQVAIAHEAKRVAGLVVGGFASANEAEQKIADTEAKQAELLSARAQLQRVTLEVNDCVVRAPFDGEVAERLRDPGAFAHPGIHLLTVVDRNIVRVTADVPEGDFAAVAPGRRVKIRMLANGQHLVGKITRRSPAADLATRTIHFEVDLPDPKRTLPVGTSAELTIEVGDPRPATAIPLIAAAVRGSTATLFVVQGATSRKLNARVVGEAGNTLYVDPALPAGARVVIEGRTSLRDGDHVAPQLAPFPAGASADEP
jgi:membrane fusion protein, multidrug efflux system